MNRSCDQSRGPLNRRQARLGDYNGAGLTLGVMFMRQSSTRIYVEDRSKTRCRSALLHDAAGDVAMVWPYGKHPDEDAAVNKLRSDRASADELTTFRDS